MGIDSIKLPEKSIIVEENITVIRRSRRKTGDISKITGLLKEYRDKFSSVELQHKAKDWWIDVSD